MSKFLRVGLVIVILVAASLPLAAAEAAGPPEPPEELPERPAEVYRFDECWDCVQTADETNPPPDDPLRSRLKIWKIWIWGCKFALQPPRDPNFWFLGSQEEGTWVDLGKFTLRNGEYREWDLRDLRDQGVWPEYKTWLKADVVIITLDRSGEPRYCNVIDVPPCEEAPANFEYDFGCLAEDEGWAYAWLRNTGEVALDVSWILEEVSVTDVIVPSPMELILQPGEEVSGEVYVRWHIITGHLRIKRVNNGKVLFDEDVSLGPCEPIPALPVCDYVVTNPPAGAKIPEEGTEVQVEIVGQNGSLYQSVEVETGRIAAGPSESNVLTHHALPGVDYQGQVYSPPYGWTDYACTYSFELYIPPRNASWFLTWLKAVLQDQPRGPYFEAGLKNWTTGSQHHVERVWIDMRIEHLTPEGWVIMDEAWFTEAMLATRGYPIEVSGSTLHHEIGEVGPYVEEIVEGQWYLDPLAAPGIIRLWLKVSWVCPFTGKVMGNEAEAKVEILPRQGVQRQTDDDTYYTVVSGDNLSSIAASFGTTVPELVQANADRYPTLETNPNYIQVGWVLLIP